MKAKILNLIAGVVMASAGSASAVTIADSINPPVPSNGNFDITDDGFSPALQTVNSATASFVFFDVDFLAEVDSVTISLGGVPALTVTDFDGTYTAEVILSRRALKDLNKDGVISYAITTNSGIFFTTFAILQASVTTDPVPVPDGGATVALLGMSLCGLVGLNRRFARK